MLKHTNRTNEAIELALAGKDQRPGSALSDLWKQAASAKRVLGTLKGQGEDIDNFMAILNK